MYNSVIECCKSIKYVYWVKKDLFRLVWKVWLYRRHSKRNRLIKITMTITTVLHSRAAPSLKYLPFVVTSLLLLFSFINSWFAPRWSTLQSCTDDGEAPFETASRETELTAAMLLEVQWQTSVTIGCVDLVRNCFKNQKIDERIEQM